MTDLNPKPGFNYYRLRQVEACGVHITAMNEPTAACLAAVFWQTRPASWMVQGIPFAVTGVTCDVSDLAQVEALAEFTLTHFKRFDVWVNNAGYAAPYGPAAHVGPSSFMRVVQTNIVGTYNGSIVALRHFLPARRGKLINILGRGSDGEASPNQSAYAASKAWEASFTRTLAKEYRASGVGIYSARSYYLGSPPAGASFLMGYSSVNEDGIRRGIEILAKVVGTRP